MNENKHTPEPWHHRRGKDGHEVWATFDETSRMRVAACGWAESFDQANARRITACVNACEGIPTDALERSKSLDEFMRSMKVIEQQRDSFKDAAEYNKRRAEDAEKQRDELLDELEKAASYHASHECYSEAKRVRAFIASVKGEQ